MTLTRSLHQNHEPFHVAVKRSRRRRKRSQLEALLTGACVAGGVGAASVLLPPLETPASVAQTFLEARYAEDWPAAWAVSCRLAREAHGSYAAFTERLTELNEYSMTPSDVEVEISDAYGIDQPGAQGVSIRYTAKPSGGNHEPWSDWGETLVVLEDGEFRVCIADR